MHVYFNLTDYNMLSSATFKFNERILVTLRIVHAKETQNDFIRIAAFLWTVMYFNEVEDNRQSYIYWGCGTMRHMTLFLAALLIILMAVPVVFAEFSVHEIGPLSEALRLDAVDMDNDGDWDVLANGRHPGQVVWFENDGEQNFIDHILVEYDDPAYVYVIDIDEDGDNDFFVSYDLSADTYIWFENQGNMTFVEHILDYYAYDARSLAFGDIDLDGDIDIFGAGGGFANIYWNEGFGEFIEMPTNSFLNGATAGQLVDLNNDGLLDLIGAVFNDNNVSIGFNDGDSTFTHYIVDNLSDCHWLDILDMNDDGMLDILASDTNDELVMYYEQTEFGFDTHVVSMNVNSPRDIAGGDFDNDGDLDIAVCEYGATYVSVFENLGDLTFGKIVIAQGLNGPSDLEAIDFNSDGNVDLVVTVSNDDQVVWLENDGGELTSTVGLTVTPFMDPIVIPASGGFLLFDVDVNNNFPVQLSGNIWGTLTDPFGDENEATPIYPLNLWPISHREFNYVTLVIPGDADAGDYQFNVNIGLHPWIYTTDGFPFTKEAGVADGTSTEWKVIGLNPDKDEAEISGQPEVASSYSISSAYPNPFNPNTSVHVAVPESAELSVVVYDVTGRLVVTLHDGLVEAGQHTINWNAEGSASGIYLVRAIVPGKMDQVQKVTLIR
jgi:FG-GAP-like repeat/Secretion system C-terminal sorting domain